TPHLRPLWATVSPKATDEGCSRECKRLIPSSTPHPSRRYRADPPSPTRGEGETALTSPAGRWRRRSGWRRRRARPWRPDSRWPDIWSGRHAR
ncbi:hypothetical protein FJ987_19250, partial [Mesorhizobium sp. CU2]